MIYLMHCKNFCKCSNVPSPNTTLIEKNKIIVLVSNLDNELNIHLLKYEKINQTTSVYCKNSELYFLILQLV
jgi:hypothetical protein